MAVVLFNIVGRRIVQPCIWFCICNEFSFRCDLLFASVNVFGFVHRCLRKWWWWLEQRCASSEVYGHINEPMVVVVVVAVSISVMCDVAT